MPFLIGFGGILLRALAGASIATILRASAGLLLRIAAIKGLILVLWASLWATIIYFGKTVLTWFIDLAFYMLGAAMETLNFPDVMTSMLTATQSLPETVVKFIFMVGVFDTIRFWISCYFANRALRIVPIVGRAFGG